MPATITRAYSLLHIKAINEKTRQIVGIATTPEPDRSGDIVEPLGVAFTNPLPLLLHHDHKRPIGTVEFDAPTKKGITFKAMIPIVDEPGELKNRTDEAWHSVKYQLITGASIGFTEVQGATEMLKSGGLRFLKSIVVELSLVTIPANADATIRTVKSLAATGRVPPPRATGLPVVTARQDAPAMKTIQEQITAFENTRAASVARMTDLMTKAADAGVTLDAAQTDDYDTLTSEVASIDAHLVRLRAHEKTIAATATPIVASSIVTPEAAASARAAHVVTVKSLLPKGTAFTRYAMAIAATRGNRMEAIEYAKRWHDSTPEVELVLKAAIAAGSTTDATWAAPLAALTPLAGEFLELLRPMTILGKIPNLRNVPFNVSVPTQTAGGTYGWVGQGAAKPVSNLQFGTTTLGMAKAAGIIVLTEELVRVSSPSAESAVRNDMIKGIAQFLDAQFVTPAVAEVVGVSPASITNGTVALVSAGSTPANGRTDILGLMGTVLTANGDTANLVLLMSQTNAMALGAALNPLGQPIFPNLGATGGTILGIPVITSQALGANVILLDAQGILFADDGGVAIDVSREASIQMDSAPDSPGDGDTVLVSLWQNNLVGLRAERWINWKRATLASVKYVVQTYI